MGTEIQVKYLPLWSRYLDMFRESGLTKTQVGQLLWMTMEYQFEGKEPETIPKAMRTVWVFLRKDLDDARGHYETSVKNGRKGGRKKKQPQSDPTAENPEKPGTTQQNPEEGTSTSSSSSTSTTTSSSTSTDTGSAPAQTAGVCVQEHSFGEFGWVKLTHDQYRNLEASMGGEELRRCIAYIDESAQSNGNRNRWKDWYLLIRRCHENRWHETRNHSAKPEIPKGASGILGEAELEAIARVLREGG